MHVLNIISLFFLLFRAIYDSLSYLKWKAFLIFINLLYVLQLYVGSGLITMMNDFYQVFPNECCYFHQIKTWLSDQWPSFPGDGRWFQGEAGWGLVTWSPGGGREASFVCLAEYAILSPGHTPHRMSGQLTPLWLPQVSWSRVSLLCCLHIMVRIQQTMPALWSSTRYCISLTLPSLFSFVLLWSDWG